MAPVSRLAWPAGRRFFIRFPAEWKGEPAHLLELRYAPRQPRFQSRPHHLDGRRHGLRHHHGGAGADRLHRQERRRRPASELSRPDRVVRQRGRSPERPHDRAARPGHRADPANRLQPPGRPRREPRTARYRRHPVRAGRGDHEADAGPGQRRQRRFGRQCGLADRRHRPAFRPARRLAA